MFRKLLLVVFVLSLQIVYADTAANWSIMAFSEKWAADTLFAADLNSNVRAVVGGMDMDGDGKKEVVATNFIGHRVMVYEFDADNNAFDVVWVSPTVDSTNYAYGPKAVGVGDLDNDGKAEIIFPSAAWDSEGLHIFEWDGVVGSDNYGTTYSTVCALEVDMCCAGDGPGTDSYGLSYKGDHEAVRVMDIDGDGRQEVILPVYDGSPKGTIIGSLNEGVDIVHNAGSLGAGTWNMEFMTDISLYAGSTPWHATPADLNGDGKYEIVNHGSGFHFYNIEVEGPDSYMAPDSGTGYYIASPMMYSIFGANAFDIDNDGNDEVYYSDYYGAGMIGIGAKDIWAVDYSTGDSVLTMDSSNVAMVAAGIGRFLGEGGSGYDDSENNYLFVGSDAPENVVALEYTGDDPLAAESYTKKVIYMGELDVVDSTITIDSTGTVTATTSAVPWGYPTRIQTNWNGDMLDFDGDGRNELLVSMESITDSLKTTTKTWNADSMYYDEVVTKVVNPKPWTMLLIENGSMAPVSIDEGPARFVSPEDYRLEQNYPNPFNPSTTISYTVPINRTVSLKVYNLEGQLVRTLVDNQLMPAGAHSVIWNGDNDLSVKVASGMYIYSLEWGGMKLTKKLVLVK